MLIRLVSHFKNNPKHIDKLIAIKGLPEEWLFRELPDGEGKELIRPWTCDIDKNIPQDIRPFCEPTYVTLKYSPLERGAKAVTERKQILGVCLDFMTEPGRELWEKIERYLEGTIPRTERVPEPVVCAKDEHSAFETYAPKRSSTGSVYLEPAQVPEIDLTLYKVAPPVVAPPSLPAKPLSQVQQQADDLSCDECHKVFSKQRAVWMHKMKAHPKRQKVEV